MKPQYCISMQSSDAMDGLSMRQFSILKERNDMRRTRAKRKLLSAQSLEWIQDRLDIGVPLARVLRDGNFNLSRAAAATLVEWYALYTSNPTELGAIKASLFPEWLKPSDEVQENPDGWVYIGRFPWGYWQYDKND